MLSSTTIKDEGRTGSGHTARRSVIVAAAWLVLAGVPSARGAGAPSSAGAAAPQGCEVAATKTASPDRVYVGDEVVVRLGLAATCTGAPETPPLDLVLAIDRSSSMAEQNRWPSSIAAAQGFVDLVDFQAARVAVVTFSGGLFESGATVDLPLSGDPAAVHSTLAALPDPLFLTFATNLTAAVSTSQEVLTGPDARAEARKVIILLTDGEHNDPGAPPPLPEAERVRSTGTILITIGLSVNATAADLLRAMAGADDRFYLAPTPADLAAVYALVAQSLSGLGAIRNLVVTDDLPTEVELVPGSVSPPPTRTALGRLIWDVAAPGANWTASYRVRPRVVGRYATNVRAIADYVEPEGAAGQREFPRPMIVVVGQYAIHLPQLLNGACRPTRPFDVVLAIDTSSSMAGDKSVQARAAARAFLQLLDMPPSQAAVLWFHDEAGFATTLTADRGVALAALGQLPTASGTRIDRAVRAAADEFAQPRHDPRSAGVIVLLTDGQQTGAPEQLALDAAASARSAGLTVFTVGIGEDVSGSLLAALAGDPSRYYPAAGPAELLDIYVTIAGALPCSTGG